MSCTDVVGVALSGVAFGVDLNGVTTYYGKGDVLNVSSLNNAVVTVKLGDSLSVFGQAALLPVLAVPFLSKVTATLTVIDPSGASQSVTGTAAVSGPFQATTVTTPAIDLTPRSGSLAGSYRLTLDVGCLGSISMTVVVLPSVVVYLNKKLFKSEVLSSTSPINMALSVNYPADWSLTSNPPNSASLSASSGESVTLTINPSTALTQVYVTATSTLFPQPSSPSSSSLLAGMPSWVIPAAIALGVASIAAAVYIAGR